MDESVDMLLMLKDRKVMRINFALGKYDILDESILPFTLQGKIREVPKLDNIKNDKDMSKAFIACNHNYDSFTEWLASRVLPISRENAKRLYGIFGFEQLQSVPYKARIALSFRALSLQDNYWVKLENDDTTWDEVNLHNAYLNEDIAEVALRGCYKYLDDKKAEVLRCPELSTHGAYAKAWLRESDGLYLHKTGHNGITESKIEVMVSNLLDNCNVQHLKYEKANAFNGYTCKCKCMTDDNVSILPGMDFDSYMNVMGKNTKLEALRIDPDMIYKMMIVDYLIANPDRHGMNWGFFYDCDTMEILGCHPLYDHNNAFDPEYMRDPDFRYLYDNTKSMRDWALHAMKKVDFHFYREFTRKDFLTDRQFECFTKRAREIGVKVINDKKL